MIKPPIDHRDRGITPEADLPVPLDADPLFPHERHNWILVSLALALGMGVTVVLFKYAVDVLFVVVVLGSFGLLLHLLIRWLAETEALTPAWAIIILLVVAAVAWFAWPLASNVPRLEAFERGLHFERVLPRQVVRFLEWSEQRGWAQRLLVPFAPGEGWAAAQAGSTGVSIAVTSLQTVSKLGQAVTITAILRFHAPPAPGAPTTVQFLDGDRRIGSVAFRLSGDTAVASFTAATLAAGAHSITARYARALLFGTVTSPPLTLTVTP